MTTKDPNLIKTPITETTDVSSVPASSDIESDTNTVNHEAISKKEAGEVVNTEHVNEGDLPARSPDRRDQVGQPFDGSINEESFGKDSPQSDDLTTFNRYANVDNAQTRVLSNHEQLTNHDE